MNHKTFLFFEMLVYHEYFDLFCSDYTFPIFFKITFYSEGQQFYVFIEKFHNLSISKELSGFYTWGGLCLFIVVLTQIHRAIAKSSYSKDQNKHKESYFWKNV